MTISVTTSSVVYTGTATTAVYPYTWAIAQAADLIVYTLNSADTTITKLALTTDYTVSGAGFPTGGNVTLVAGNLASGTRLFIASDPGQIQALLLEQGGAFNPADLMAALDLLTREVQANRRLAANSIQIPVAESLDGHSLVAPAKATRAGALLGFDANGDVTTSGLSPSILSFTSAATIAALKAIAPPANGTVYQVSGYNTANDGGGGLFVFVAADVTADNAGTIIQANAGGAGRWNRLYSGEVNARWFGAVGNGVANDTVAIQAAITLSRRVYIPAGTYLINATIDPSVVNQWITGDGINVSGGTVIKWNGATSSTMMKAPGGASRIDGIRFDGNSVASVSGIVASDTRQPGRASWGTVDIANCLAVGLDLSVTGAATGIYYNNFGTMRVQGCGTGVRLKTTSGGTALVNANSWTHLVAIANVTGVEINLADGNAWMFLDSENNTSIGVDVVKGNSNVIWGGWLEGNTTWHLRIADNPDVLKFAFFGQISQDNKISYVNSNNRSLLLPVANSDNWRLAGRWWAEEIQVQDAAGGNLCDIVANSIGFNRSSSAGFCFVDQRNTTSGTGIQWRVSITTAGDTPLIGGDNSAAGGTLGFYATSAAPIAKPTVTGSRGSNAALTSLLTALANLGLITNSSS